MSKLKAQPHGKNGYCHITDFVQSFSLAANGWLNLFLSKGKYIIIKKCFYQIATLEYLLKFQLATI